MKSKFLTVGLIGGAIASAIEVFNSVIELVPGVGAVFSCLTCPLQLILWFAIPMTISYFGASLSVGKSKKASLGEHMKYGIFAAGIAFGIQFVVTSCISTMITLLDLSPVQYPAPGQLLTEFPELSPMLSGGGEIVGLMISFICGIIFSLIFASAGAYISYIKSGKK